MERQKGIALLNALVLVAAISAVAASLMLRAEHSRVRLSHMQGAAQAMLYLDSAELLIEPVLRGDWKRDQNVDHLSEGWATTAINAEVDRGTLTGDLRDLQGLFNVNALNNQDDVSAVQSFEHLLGSLDLPQVLAREVAGYVQRRGPADQAVYTGRDLALNPAMQKLDDIRELRLINGMTSAAYTRLLPYVWAGPASNMPVNVNTAPREVLAAFYPAASVGNIDRLMAERSQAFFASKEDYNTRIAKTMPAAVLLQARIPAGGLSVTSEWFEATFTAVLNDTSLSRRLVVQRDRLTGKTDIIRRLAVQQ